MTDEVVIDLVYDPHRIYAGDGLRITGLTQGTWAFHAVGDQLRQSGDPATTPPRAATSSTALAGSTSAVSAD